MSRIRVRIDRLVLSGFEPRDRKALLEGLQSELTSVLAEPAGRAAWAYSHRAPVLRLGGLAVEPGPAGGRKFGGTLARAIGKGLKP